VPGSQSENGPQRQTYLHCDKNQAASMMRLKGSQRQQSFRSSWELNLTERGLLVIAGLLLLMAGFEAVNFLLNFDQLQRLAEEFNGAAGASARALDAQSGSKENVSVPLANDFSVHQARVASWLVSVNRYRAMVGLPPLTADAQLSRADSLHSRYLAMNYGSQLPGLNLGAEAHTEDPAKPGFTSEGAAAAAASDIDWSWDPGSPRPATWAIDSWMQAPFHRMSIISPYLRKVGYGSDCEGAVCFAALNISTGQIPALPQLWSTPVAFPPDGSVMHLATFNSEWPDPLTSCHGYVSPAGLPITLELGHLIVPDLTDFSLKQFDRDRPIEACAFTANTYVNPDVVAKNTARAILRDFGAIVLVPRQPLLPGRYGVSITAGRTYSWSFSLAPNHE
jgi:hypothetical protein